MLQESLSVCITHPPPLHHLCTLSVYFLLTTIMPIHIKYSQGVLTQGPKPGPASWLGTQVTQMVASASNWCLSRQVSPHMTHGLATGIPPGDLRHSQELSTANRSGLAGSQLRGGSRSGPLFSPISQLSVLDRSNCS